MTLENASTREMDMLHLRATQSRSATPRTSTAQHCGFVYSSPGGQKAGAWRRATPLPLLSTEGAAKAVARKRVVMVKNCILAWLIGV